MARFVLSNTLFKHYEGAERAAVVSPNRPQRLLKVDSFAREALRFHALRLSLKLLNKLL